MKEAEFLVDKGVREILLIAQDLTSYGLDIYKKRSLGKLLEELDSIHNLVWIKLHYTYPLGFPADEIISTMNNSPKICKYLDVPIQHINNKILSSMNRGHSREEIEDLIKHFRDEIPNIAIRTTLITGFPGETEQDFIELKEYVQATHFDRLGVFTYSEEEGTPAANKLKDDVPQEVKEARKEEILSIQQHISLQLNLDKIGKTFKVIIDRVEGEFYAGRTEYDSPEIDNEVLIPMDSAELKPGQFCEVLITDAMEFDLFGEVKGV
jgi:ribosomal protein S12 methylthiotransferase